MAGPPLVSGAATRQVQRCTVVVVQLFPGGGKTCEWAFEAGDGTQVTFEALRLEISNSLRNIERFHPFQMEFRRQYHPRGGRNASYQEYRLYLVALKPTVLVGIPVSPRVGDRCYAPNGQDCFGVSPPPEAGKPQDTWSIGVYYSERPPVAEGAFAYLATPGTESVALASGQAEVELGAAGQRIRLVNVNGTWQVQPQSKMHQ